MAPLNRVYTADEYYDFEDWRDVVETDQVEWRVYWQPRDGVIARSSDCESGQQAVAVEHKLQEAGLRVCGIVSFETRATVVWEDNTIWNETIRNEGL